MVWSASTIVTVGLRPPTLDGPCRDADDATGSCQPSARSRFELVFCLDFSVPSERALRVLSAGAMAAVRDRGVLAEPAPKARIDGVGTIGVNYKVRYWIVPAEILVPS